ncbi:hypothetical protein [Variovorax sp. dw_308]|uniref:hypothetical protein n=1 Tax=Variovorax sp. dw_308 TaxID=2721546 RepID=UPI001C45D47D|nr:hypothetical protein [Variovorax sp. dw_308]
MSQDPPSKWTERYVVGSVALFVVALLTVTTHTGIALLFTLPGFIAVCVGFINVPIVLIVCMICPPPSGRVN